VDHHDKTGQVEISRKMQIQRAAYDAMGLCAFLTSATGQTPQVIIDLVNTLYGIDFTVEQWNSLALETIKREIEFNRAAGLGKDTDRIPEYFKREKLPPFDLLWDLEDEELEAVFGC
jgi:aldehyde:ferredoxin oxidoreductase